VTAPVSSFAEQMAVGRVHARTSTFAARLEWARQGVQAMLRAAPKSYVSLSFGKQSQCVAHLVYQVAPETPMFFLASEETWGLYDYADVIEQFRARWPIRLTVVQTHRLSGAATWKEARDVGDRDLQTMCVREEWDGWYWGLSLDESKARRMTLLNARGQETTHTSIFRYVNGQLRCCPIQRWRLDDLAAYISTHDLPMLNIYQRYGLSQRTTARITRKMVEYDGLALARATNSRGFRTFVDRFPEVER